jgi:hypothetical protein
VQPGSANASVLPAKSRKAPSTTERKLEAERGVRVSREGEGRESRWKKQSMCSSFVFNLDKIRKIPNESPILTNESLNNPDKLNLDDT